MATTTIRVDPTSGALGSTFHFAGVGYHRDHNYWARLRGPNADVNMQVGSDTNGDLGFDWQITEGGGGSWQVDVSTVETGKPVAVVTFTVTA